MVALLALLLLSVSTLRAEAVAPRGEIKLIVVDPDQRPIPGVTVSLLRADTNRPTHTVITDATGEVTFSRLPAGDYTVKCELIGFITTMAGPMRIELVNASPRLPGELKIMLNPGPIWY